jgi:DNA-binding XRE family transcriptional regulator
MNDDLQYVVRQLVDTNLAAIAKKVGLSYMTVYRIAKGTNTSPSYATVKALADHFREKA